jgi:hypothetical protein
MPVVNYNLNVFFLGLFFCETQWNYSFFVGDVDAYNICKSIYIRIYTFIYMCVIIPCNLEVCIMWLPS